MLNDVEYSLCNILVSYSEIELFLTAYIIETSENNYLRRNKDTIKRTEVKNTTFWY